MTTDPIRVSDGIVSLHSNLAEIERLFRKAPDAVFRHVRDYFGQIFGSHRREWLRQTQVDIRGGKQGIRATPVSDQPTVPGWQERGFFYRVVPRSKTRAKGQTLEAIRGETYTGSSAAELQEFGGSTRPKRSRYLALPTGVTLRSDGRPVPVWRTPRKFLAAKSGNELVSLDVGSGPMLYQVVRASAKRAAKDGAIQRASDGRRKRSERRILLPAYRLVRAVHHRPLLRYYAVWDSLAGDRSARLSRTMDAILREVARA